MRLSKVLAVVDRAKPGSAPAAYGADGARNRSYKCRQTGTIKDLLSGRADDSACVWQPVLPQRVRQFGEVLKS